MLANEPLGPETGTLSVAERFDGPKTGTTICSLAARELGPLAGTLSLADNELGPDTGI